jgi:nucleoside-diphosphate-sugar epimerase
MKIYLAGHNGMVGSAILRRLKSSQHGGQENEIIVRKRKNLDLIEQSAVRDFMQQERPDVVILAAARVGGIHANNIFPAEFIYENLMIQNNLIDSAYSVGVQTLLFLGSSCIYPRLAAQPIREEALLTGLLEPTNEPYAVAKIAGIKMCESYSRQYGVDYRCIMPTNLYGPGDNFHPQNSHVVPGLIRRFHEAKENNIKEVMIWGSGKPCREFLHVDDMASASLFILGLDKKTYTGNTQSMMSHINVGSGEEISIADLAVLIGSVVGYRGQIRFDSSKPDGSPRKLMDTTRLKSMGWEPRIALYDGLINTYQWFLDHSKKLLFN